MPEIAYTLGVSTSTVEKDLRFSSAWLKSGVARLEQYESGGSGCGTPCTGSRPVSCRRRPATARAEGISGTRMRRRPELLGMVEQLLAEDRNGSILPEPKPAPSPPRRSLTGLTLSHYRVLEPLGEGGMGTVYRAIDTRLDRTVALKFQPPRILRDAENRHRFWREAKTIASIDHPNVCPVYGMEEDGEFLFIAMAYLDGIPLDRRIASGGSASPKRSKSLFRRAGALKRRTPRTWSTVISNRRT